MSRKNGACCRLHEGHHGSHESLYAASTWDDGDAAVADCRPAASQPGDRPEPTPLTQQLADAEARVQAMPAGIRETDPRWQEMQRRRSEPIPEGLSAEQWAQAMEGVVGHWFIQGGRSQFGDIGQPQNEDETVAAILRVVRDTLDALTAERDRLRSALMPALEILGALHHSVQWELAPEIKAAIASALPLLLSALTPPPSTGETGA